MGELSLRNVSWVQGTPCLLLLQVKEINISTYESFFFIGYKIQLNKFNIFYVLQQIDLHLFINKLNVKYFYFMSIIYYLK